MIEETTKPEESLVKESGSNENKDKLKDLFANTNIVAIYLLVVTILILWGIIKAWPGDNELKTDSIKKDSSFIYFGKDSSVRIDGRFEPPISTLLNDTSKLNLKVTVNDSVLINASRTMTPKRSSLNDRLLIILILLIGALGSNLHGLISLSGYVGNKSFESSWLLWYILRPFAGAILSFIFYLTIKAGFFDQVTIKDFYTIAALSGLVGMFSKQAINKLSDLFDFIFASNKDKELKDKMTSVPTLKIDSIIPDKIIKGSTDTELTITGSGFVDKSIIRINQNEEFTPTSVKSDQLKFILPAKLIKDNGKLRITVVNPEPKGGLSNSKEVTIA
jgi:hypothetical protein